MQHIPLQKSKYYFGSPKVSLHGNKTCPTVCRSFPSDNTVSTVHNTAGSHGLLLRIMGNTVGSRSSSPGWRSSSQFLRKRPAQVVHMITSLSSSPHCHKKQHDRERSSQDMEMQCSSRGQNVCQEENQVSGDRRCAKNR